MTFIRKRRAGLLAGAVPATLAFAWSSGAGAQDAVGDFRLPPAPSSSPASPAGPVDPEHPVVLPPQPTAAPGRPATAASPTASPSPAPLAPPAAQPGPREVPRTAPSPRAEAAAPPRTAAPESAATPAPSPAASQFPAEPVAREAAADASAAFRWPVALAALAALLAVGAILLIRRRRRSPGPADEAASAEVPVAAPAPPPPTPTPPPPPPAAPAAGGAAPLTVVGMRFDPRELRLSLVYATLAYEIVLTNLGRSPCGPVRVVGDMISAHASLGSAVQLAPDALQPLHDAALLAPNDTLALRGQLRLPLSEVRMIGDGRQAMFIPLVRLRLEMEDGGRTVAPARIFAVGLAAPGAQTQLAPIRLDLGPRAIRDLGMLEVEVGKWLPADALRQAAG